MKKHIVIYPFLFALFPVLALYAHNMGGLSLASIWMPLAFSFSFALLLFILSWLLFRDAMKAGIITLAILVIFFADGRMYGILLGWGWLRPAKYHLIAWGIFFTFVVYLIARTKRQLNNITTILNVVVIFLVVFSLVDIGVYEFRRPSYDIQIDTRVESQPDEVGTLPDIYYIILDAYSSASILEELYDFDNSAFIDYLISKGFYIGNQSMSNYGCTELSLPSSLNLEYINYLSEVVGEQSKDLRIPVKMIKNNSVMNFLRSFGYRYVNLETEAKPMGYNEYADLNIPCAKSNLLGSTYQDQFITLLIETTILHHLQDSTTEYREYVLNAFDKLAEMPDLQGPKFVFAHILCPHPPYVFGANGERIEAVSYLTEAGQVQCAKYLDQVKFINGKIETLVDDILSESKIPPIIILQGDHGSRLCCGARNADQCTKAQFGILNAFFLPNGGDKLLYQAISPVNSFRVVFDFYFGADYELLPDQSFASNFQEAPYKFFNVTDQLTFH